MREGHPGFLFARYYPLSLLLLFFRLDRAVPVLLRAVAVAVVR
jgi:hypothetical protein